jgi:hypothetical protein
VVLSGSGAPSHAINVRDWHEWLLGNTKEPAERERVATEVIDVLHRRALRLVSNGCRRNDRRHKPGSALIDQVWTAWLKVMKPTA